MRSQKRPAAKLRFFMELFYRKSDLRKRPASPAEQLAIVRQQQERNASTLAIQATEPTALAPADPGPPQGVHF
jgi:hypothetical protein